MGAGPLRPAKSLVTSSATIPPRLCPKKCKWQVTHERPKRVNQTFHHIFHAPQWFFCETVLAAWRLNRQDFDMSGEFIGPVAIARGPASGRWQAEESDAGIRTRPVTGNPGCCWSMTAQSFPPPHVRFETHPAARPRSHRRLLLVLASAARDSIAQEHREDWMRAQTVTPRWFTERTAVQSVSLPQTPPVSCFPPFRRFQFDPGPARFRHRPWLKYSASRLMVGRRKRSTTRISRPSRSLILP
jgi:hypothetical protein